MDFFYFALREHMVAAPLILWEHFAHPSSCCCDSRLSIYPPIVEEINAILMPRLIILKLGYILTHLRLVGFDRLLYLFKIWEGFSEIDKEEYCNTMIPAVEVENDQAQ
ncbi:MAG TPA: hypothetical protein PLZ49_05825 [Bacillota bacterium]|jgi:hypothetical protein|nr:hypothetical protein [Bacillota bacterium]HOL15698.1 hypothetical protein [Bacillota bacterium]